MNLKSLAIYFIKYFFKSIKKLVTRENYIKITFFFGMVESDSLVPGAEKGTQKRYFTYPVKKVHRKNISLTQ